MAEDKKDPAEEIVNKHIEEATPEVVIEDSISGEVIEEEPKKIEKLEGQVTELTDKYQRNLAEFDNFRKRTAREKASMYDDGVRDTVEKLLLVVDNLERAIASHCAGAEDSFLKGVEMTLKQFQEVLHGIGVEEIEALGQKFDPNFHAAVAHEEDENYGENEITLVMLKGYKYKDKVLRHSMVKVAN